MSNSSTGPRHAAMPATPDPAGLHPDAALEAEFLHHFAQLGRPVGSPPVIPAHPADTAHRKPLPRLPAVSVSIVPAKPPLFPRSPTVIKLSVLPAEPEELAL